MLRDVHLQFADTVGKSFQRPTCVKPGNHRLWHVCLLKQLKFDNFNIFGIFSWGNDPYGFVVVRAKQARKTSRPQKLPEVRIFRRACLLSTSAINVLLKQDPSFHTLPLTTIYCSIMYPLLRISSYSQFGQIFILNFSSALPSFSHDVICFSQQEKGARLRRKSWERWSGQCVEGIGLKLLSIVHLAWDSMQ